MTRLTILLIKVYSYIISGKNGFILKDIEAVRNKVITISEAKIDEMKIFSREHALANLSLSGMVDNFANGIGLIYGD